jgi:aryl-alcohol dehydrogenase-like predicted oxidoreductase
MEYWRLGASGFTVPVLSFGTGTFGGRGAFFEAWGSTDVAEARRLVDICLDAGLSMFDSADVYSGGVAEEILGKAIEGRPRDSIIISTKATFRSGQAPNQVGSSRYHPIEAVHKALKHLGTDYIDLFQLHGFDAMTPAEEVLSTLDQLVRPADRFDHHHRRPQRRTTETESRSGRLEPDKRPDQAPGRSELEIPRLSLLASARRLS